MNAEMETFRVFNNTRRVGVGFMFGGVLLQVPTFAVLFALVFAAVASTAAASAVSGLFGTVLTAVIVVVWLGVFLTVLVYAVAFSRLSPVEAQVRDSTQFKLLKESVAQMRYRNYRTPDTNGPRIYRNY